MYFDRISTVQACKMPVDNLATVFGPTVVGYSTAEPAMNQILTQTKTQQLVNITASVLVYISLLACCQLTILYTTTKSVM